MLELYHNINSVCAQKVRIALKEKRQEPKDHIMTLRGDQYEPAYLRLNPNGVVPTLIHDGEPITESSLILYYIDDAFPEPPLMPKPPRQRHRVRMYNKLIDEYVHNSCTILTFATAFRPAFLKMPAAVWQAEINKAPLKRRAEYKRSVIEHGLDSEFVTEALGHHRKLLSWMADSLKSGPYLAGESFSNAECAVIPYILRLELLKLSRMWDSYPSVAEWWARMRTRPSVKAAIFDRMTEADAAPFTESCARSLAQGAGVAESGLRDCSRNIDADKKELRMSLKEQLAEYRAGWYQRVPAERQAIMQRHIDQLRAGTIARTMLKVGDQAPPIVLKNAKGAHRRRWCADQERSRHRHLLSRRLVSLLQPRTEGISGDTAGDRGRGSIACRDQPGKTRRHTVDRGKERAQVRGAQRPRPKGRTCIRPGLRVHRRAQAGLPRLQSGYSGPQWDARRMGAAGIRNLRYRPRSLDHLRLYGCRLPRPRRSPRCPSGADQKSRRGVTPTLAAPQSGVSM